MVHRCGEQGRAAQNLAGSAPCGPCCPVNATGARPVPPLFPLPDWNQRKSRLLVHQRRLLPPPVNGLCCCRRHVCGHAGQWLVPSGAAWGAHGGRHRSQ